MGADFFVRVFPLETEYLMRLGSAAAVRSWPFAFQLPTECVDQFVRFGSGLIQDIQDTRVLRKANIY